jgi:hypothetical protein
LKTVFYTLIMVAVMLAACSPKQTAKAPEQATADQPYELEQEGTIPPPEETASKPEADVEEIAVDDREIVGEDVAAPKDTTRAAGRGPKTVEGKDGGFAIPVYRVQVLATTSEQSALDTKKKIENRLSLPAYVKFEDGMFKVRVGDCSTREEAEKVRGKVRGAGYTDAWIVTDVLRGQPEKAGPDD